MDETAVNFNEQIELTCTTDFCNPAAKITWFKESLPVENNVIETFDFNENGLIRTTSVLTYIGAKEDNLKRIYCRAINILNTVHSLVYSLDVKCKYVFHRCLYYNHYLDKYIYEKFVSKINLVIIIVYIQLNNSLSICHDFRL